MMKHLVYFIVLVVFSSLLSKPSSADLDNRGILYWQKKNNRVEMRVYLPERRSSLLIATFKDRPYRLFFSNDWKAVFYISVMHLYKMEWKTGARPVRLLTFPKYWPTIDDNFLWIWRDKVSKKWRIGYVDEKLHKYRIISKKTGGVKKEYIRHKGDLVLISNPYFKHALGVAIVREYDKHRGWQTIVKKTTTCNAQSDPCFSVVDAYYRPDALMSDESLRINMLAHKTKLVPYNTTGKGDVKTIIYKTNLDTDTLIKVRIGESYQFFPPLSLISKDTNKEIILLPEKKGRTSPYNYLGIQQYKHHLLVTQSINATRGRLFNLTTGKLEFSPPEKSPAIWVRLPRN